MSLDTSTTSDLLRKLALGSLMAAALMLSLPGVETARADEPGFSEDPALVQRAARNEAVAVAPPAAPAAAAEACEAGQTPNREVIAMEQRVQAMRAAAERKLARGAAPGSAAAGPTVMLNNRGYNY